MSKLWFLIIAAILLAGNLGASYVKAADAAEITASTIQAQIPLLDSDFKVAAVRPLRAEDAAAKRYRKLLENYLVYVKENLKPFPADSKAIFHKSDNSAEHAVRQNATVAFALATLDKYGDPRALKKDSIDPGKTAISLIRYLAVTHKANLLPTGDGKKWGDHWQSALWAAFAAHAAWLEWDGLDPETRVMVARMVEHEADRYNTRPPDDGEWDDTKAEENAWNAKIIVLAHCMFPNHPRSDLWRERSIVYLLNAVSTASDRSDSRIVDGKPLKDRVTTTVIHNDFTLENHSRVHPDYLAGTVGLQLRNSIVYALAGQPISEAALYHAREMYEVAKLLTATNGSHLYINGQDWWPHRHDVPLMAGGFVAPMLNDGSASFMEMAALGTLEKMHTRFKNGRAFHPHEIVYPNVEEEMMARYAELYFAHRLFDYPRAVSRKEFVAQTSGARIFDAGGFVIHRTPRKVASFAWKNPVMGLIYPESDTWFTSPDTTSLLGRLSVDGVADSPASLDRQSARVIPASENIESGGFVVCGDANRCDGAITQQFAFISVGDEAAIYSERLIANRDLTLSMRATGSIAILNEDAKPLEDNVRRLTTNNGKVYITGASEDPESVRVLDGRYLNIEDRISLVSVGSGDLAIRENHKYARGRLTQEIYSAYSNKPLSYKKGDIIDIMSVGFVADTKRNRRVELLTETTNNEIVSIDFEGWLAGVNFSKSDAYVKLGESEVKVEASSVQVRKR